MSDHWTPVARILADGQDVTARMKDRLISLTVTDEAGSTSDTARIVLDDRDAVFEVPPTGAQLTIGIGWLETGGPVDMGVYVVDELSFEGPERRFSISAKAADSLDRNAPGRIKAPKSRSWHDTTLGVVVRQIAKEHGFEAVVGSKFDKIEIPHLDQTEESDINLLRRLAKENGAVVKPASGKLLFVGEGKGKTASGKSMPAVALAAKDCARWSMKIAKRAAYKQVIAQWHDGEGGDLQQVKAGSGEPSQTLKHTYASADEAQRAAAAGLKRAQRGERTAEIEATGNPALVAEAPLTLSGFRTGVDGGDWVITRATHTLTNSGYVTSITAEPPGQDDDDDEDDEDSGDES